MVIKIVQKQYHFIIICFIFLQLLISAEVGSSTIERSKKMDIIYQHQIQNPNSRYDYSLKQIQVIASTINAMSRVITNESTLEQEKNIIGEIEYAYPKDSKKTITSAFFRIASIGHSGSFRRLSDKHPWHECDLIIARMQEPYIMGLTKYFFINELGLTFEKSFFEKREHTQIPEYHVFYFHKKVGDVTLQYIFDTRPDASSLKDGYPKAFHRVRIYNTAVKK